MAISKEPSGTYEMQAWYKDSLGKRHKKHKRGFKTKTEARKYEAEFLLKRDGSPKMTFGDFVDLYEADRKPQFKLNTWLTKRHMIDSKIIPYFGEKQLDSIEPIDILNWQNSLRKMVQPTTGKPYSGTYIRTINNQLSAILNHAVRYYGLRENPMSRVGKIGKSHPPEMQFWTKEEYLRFSDAVADKPMSFAAFEVLYWTGIREGELLALSPEDLDLDKNLLRISKSCQRLQGEDVITTPKTPKSNRTIATPAFLAEEVAEHIELHGVQPGERLFPVSKSYLANEMQRGSKLAGVKRIRIHNLRHSHVSLLIELGFSALAIADRMGHEAVGITYRYAHLFPSVQTDMARALEANEGEDKQMSEKLLDQHGRHRNVTVAFRVSREESDLLNRLVALSGLTKQDYITSKLLDREVTVVPGSRTRKALRDEMIAVYRELRRIRDDTGISPELETVISAIAAEFIRLGAVDDKSDVEKEDRAISTLARK